MRKASGRLAKEIENLKKMKDENIDLTDIPATADWSNASVGKFYRPIKKSLTIRIDADVLAWLRAQGKGYQTRINAMLRAAMFGRNPSSRRKSPPSGGR
ncbi:MAG TPA: BrnA antitoxin family protein [Terriglobia bacterium]|nr:BrnA antitoxin family protein [Terriglobia bacterium]